MGENVPAVIAIDGPAASGKTTLGRALAEQLGYRFLDTGLMYRAFTLAALRAGVPPTDLAGSADLARRLDLRVEGELDCRILVEGEDVTGLLRGAEVEGNVSGYSAIPEVREVMVERQREAAKSSPSILAGRDIGTVVLPDAPLKFFLRADERARAERRGHQTAEWGSEQAASEALKDITQRDALDSTRKVSPLREAKDAVVIDTTKMGIDEVVALAMAEVQKWGAAKTAGSGGEKGAREASPAKAGAANGGRTTGGGASRRFYWACTHLLRGILWVVARWTVTGREHIPMSGGLIVVSNHLNNADPPILGSGIARRRVHFMAKVELFKPPFGFIPRWYGAFPVKRLEADVGAMMTAERMLKRGEVIGMFPEGTRSRTGRMGRPHPGTAMIALRSGATILPCGMVGTEQLRNPFNVLRKPKIAIAIGEPIRLEAVRRPTEAQVSELTELIYAAIAELIPPQYRGTYTGSNGSDHPGE